MSTIRRFRAMDMFNFGSVNLDRYTETYDLSFYLSYLSSWPDLFNIACRRLGLGRGLMQVLEDASEKIHNCYFVDLFVRPSNKVAIAMYEGMGYIVYREVIDYYMTDGIMPTESAFDMRKALARDVHKKSVVPLKRPITVDELFNPRR
ncbi:hypothetical protein BX661DRAFT_184691 [Kickxella alabastrina]|uniref:uncharacterized protein n=1 Tax=Kickxella alabastrina TaxID=61397 RepID=UPI00221F312B|nr:uncharacterized protein BX661DRAFT_184691 [Kickxella alabastrina]KAI7825499.1 hypothetical protein BX661DRAFT_184691 [Kickxella alabastrina]